MLGYLLRFRRYSVHGRSADFPQIPNMTPLCGSLFAMLRFPHFSALHTTCNKHTTLNKQQIMSLWQFVVVNI